MKKHLKHIVIYIWLLIVLVGSVIIYSLISVADLLKDIAIIPGIAALFGLLIQIWRDSTAHERAIEIQNRQQDHLLGTASHMANVAYDKHVLFCEEYISNVHEGVQQLFRDGPSKNTKDIGWSLNNIRRKHSAWLTKEIEDKLIPFEQALIKIGAQESVVDNVPQESRAEMIDEIYRSFGLILGHEVADSEAESELAKDRIVEKIRDILGIKVLTELRMQTTKLALQRVRQDSNN